MFGKKGVGVVVLVVIIAFGYNYFISKKDPSPIIKTVYGDLQGVTSVSRGGKEFYEFLGVPYAKPPVGSLRFEPPQPPEKWSGVRDASLYGSECAQLRLIIGSFGGHEDCLFLNVFVPKERKKPLPVLVFLHGGAFVTGSSNGYRPGYFMDKDVILVTVNYRLAALGFMNTGDGVIKGNMGLKDQTMALQWVKSTISAFGGDPTQVTLFGESAGSSSTSFHLISPLSKGLFSKAILQSGVFTSNWSVYRDPAKQAKRFAEKFGCTSEKTEEMVECLKKVDTKTFVNGHQELLQPLRDQITIFVPTIETIKDENAFLTDEPLALLKSGKVNKLEGVIAGVNSEEGLLTSSIITANQSKLEQANNEYEFWVSRLLNYPIGKTDVSNKIRKYYFGNVKDIANSDLIQNYTNLFSDRQFFAPVHNFAKEYIQLGSLRLYYFSYRGQFSFSRLLVSSQKPYFPVFVNVLWDMAALWVKENILGIDVPHPGVCHADELPHFFDWMLSPKIKESSKDYPMSKDVVELWANFASNDVSKLSFRGVEWETVDTKKHKHLRYLQIDKESGMINEPFEDRMKFWDTLGV